MMSTLRRRYHLHVLRELICNILRQVDPSGVAARRSHRLVRRTYWSVVLITSGMSTAKTSCAPMDLP